jgi:hypothetical protein
MTILNNNNNNEKKKKKGRRRRKNNTRMTLFLNTHFLDCLIDVMMWNTQFFLKKKLLTIYTINVTEFI